MRTILVKVVKLILAIFYIKELCTQLLPKIMLKNNNLKGLVFYGT